MTRVLHLTDLHFGLHREALVEPLLAKITDVRPDLVVVTGDLTHRARPSQFEEAAAFLARIRAPLMAVPGNHDMPLINLPVRLISPFGVYDDAISPDHAPTGAVGRVRVQGINSADPYSWQRGDISDDEIGRVLGGIDALATNIVALHHPLQQLPGVDKTLARGAPEALARFEEAGIRIVLTGHLHVWAAEALLDMGHPHILQVQGGTALCDRESDRQNEFAVLDIQGDDLRIERYIAPLGQTEFGTVQRMHLVHDAAGWRQTKGADG